MLNLDIAPAVIRDLEPWHAETFAALFQRHGADFYDWLPWQKFEDPEATRGFLTSMAEGRGAGTKRLFGIWVDDELVGGTLFPTLNAHSGVGEVGVFLAAPARGQGIVTRTVTAMLDWAFTERDMRRMEWRCAPGNAASRAIPAQLGFSHEGTLRQVFRNGDRFDDLEVWAILREEWRA